MQRKLYNLVVSHLQSMMDEVIEPYVNERVTVRLAAEMTDELTGLFAAVREIVDAFGTNTYPEIEEEDDEDLSDLDWDDILGLEPPLPTEPPSVTASIAQTEAAALNEDRSEYEQFVAKMRRDKGQ